MSGNTGQTASWRRKLALAVAVAAGVLLLFPAVSAADPKPVTPPTIQGVPGLPGPVAPAAKTASNMGLMYSTPDTGIAGEKFTVKGGGLPAGKDVSIVWSTANVTWILDARPDSVDYLGRTATNVNVVLGRTKTDAKGTFNLELTVPRDFGGIHDMYAVVDGTQVLKGGFLIRRTVEITPTKGPIGTPITIKVTGLGSSLYGSSANVYWDSHYGGVFTGNWTRGESIVHIRASGPVGAHTIVVAGGMQFNYLNYQQSPIPWATGGMATFTVTRDAGPPRARIDWPLALTPTMSTRTTLASVGLDSTGAATAKASPAAGVVLSKVSISATGLTPDTPVVLQWSTVVGNRVNCTGTCWTFQSIPLGGAKAAADGTVNATVQVPDGLGGWHVIQVVQAGEIKTQVPYYVKRSIVSFPRTVKAGKPFTVELKGVGWTQLDNTVAVVYDNSYVGYACGFNSNGDVVINLVATGGPGTHVIDMYPLLYTYQPAYPYPPHGMVPFLSFDRDAPGLALGYQLPAIRLAIRAVK